MKDLWDRLEAWGAKHGASLDLRPPASDEAIAAAEATMGLTLPEDFRASLLVHDGQEKANPKFPWMPGCDRLHPLQSFVARWREERDEDDGQGDDANGTDQEHDPRLIVDLRHPRRVPIAGSHWWDGDNTYIDLVPGSKGVPGQLITYTSECDMTVLGTSFRDALQRYVELLESGALVWDERVGVVPTGKQSWNGHRAEVFANMKAK